MVAYLLKSIVVSAIGYLVYTVLLKSEKSFVFNRFYLLLTLIMAMSWPLLEIPIEFPAFIDHQLPIVSKDTVAELETIEGTTVEIMHAPVTNWLSVLGFAYGLVSLLLAARFLYTIRKYWMKSRQSDGSIDSLRLVFDQAAVRPYSFFQFLFLHPAHHLSREVLIHESAHSRQYHTLDLLVVELIKCAFWFNPFVYLYQKSIAENHEYLADQAVQRQGVDTDQYIKTILSSILGFDDSVSLGSGFSYVLTKNRIKMLEIDKSNQVTRKIAVALLALTVTLGVSSFEFSSEKKALKVVIDVGHGGDDHGARINNVSEKSITRAIAAELASQSSKSNVMITLVGREDQSLGLKNRADRINEINPDLMISLHANWSKDNTDHGVEAYVMKNGAFYLDSRKYASMLIQSQLEDSFRTGKIKQSEDLYMLRASQCPAVLLELGFLSNEQDREMLVSKSAAKKLAKSILESLEEISEL